MGHDEYDYEKEPVSQGGQVSLGTCSKCGRELVAACDVPGCHAQVETYSRICGYFTAVSRWNPGKQQEFIDRKTFIVNQGDHGD